MTTDEYVDQEGRYCPVCGSENCTAGDRETDCGYSIQEVHCDDCGVDWEDIYALVGYNLDKKEHLNKIAAEAVQALKDILGAADNNEIYTAKELDTVFGPVCSRLENRLEKIKEMEVRDVHKRKSNTIPAGAGWGTPTSAA